MDLSPRSKSLDITTPILQASWDQSPHIKWIALFFGSLTILGPFYISVMPPVMATQILEFFAINNEQYNLIFTLGGIPNLFMPVVAGLLIDSFGSRPVLLIFNIIGIIGQIVQYTGCDNQHYELLLVGRVISTASLSTMLIARSK